MEIVSKSWLQGGILTPSLEFRGRLLASEARAWTACQLGIWEYGDERSDTDTPRHLLGMTERGVAEPFSELENTKGGFAARE